MLSPEQIADLRRKLYNATVSGLRKAHADLATIRIRPDFPIPKHQPGQYTSIGLGYWEPRHPGCQEEALKAGENINLIRPTHSHPSPHLTNHAHPLHPARYA